MFAEMTDATLATGPTGPTLVPSAVQVQNAVARFEALSSEIRGAAILGPDGSVLACSGDPARWGEAAASLLRAADSAAGRAATQGHVATEEGEVYAVRWLGLAMVAVSDRFTLASLVLSDMRALLRDLAGAQAVAA